MPSDLTLRNGLITTSGGSGGSAIYMEGTGGRVVNIERSSLKSAFNSLHVNTNNTVRVGATKLDGSVPTTTATFTCVASYNGNFAAVSTTCH